MANPANALILSTATGGGHNRVAEVLATELGKRRLETEIIDYLQLASPFLDTLINDGYNRVLSRSGFAYSWFYNATQQGSVNTGISHILHGLLARRISDLAREKKPALIISTHPLIVKTLGELKRKQMLYAPVISVVTDFIAHRFYGHPSIEAYVVPSSHTAASLAAQGIDQKRIHINGIPVSREFSQKSPEKQDNTFTVLIMAGIHASQAMYELLELLVLNDCQMRIIAICGNNSKLQQRLEQNLNCLPGNIRLEIHGYRRDIDRLMDLAHVIISKPGGITVSEAINKGLPFIIPFSISGQEEENRRFLVEAGLALETRDMANINHLLTRMIAEPDRLDRIASKMRLLASSYSLDRTVQLAEDFIRSRVQGYQVMSF